MNKVTPKIMSGFMELLPEDQILFNELVDTIRTSYESFGFLPIDTPILECSEVLLAKAGGETEKQIYRFKKGENDDTIRCTTCEENLQNSLSRQPSRSTERHSFYGGQR